MSSKLKKFLTFFASFILMAAGTVAVILAVLKSNTKTEEKGEPEKTTLAYDLTDKVSSLYLDFAINSDGVSYSFVGFKNITNPVGQLYEKTLEIPDTYENMPVTNVKKLSSTTQIEYSCYLSAVVIPDSVEEIENQAFYGYLNIEYIAVPFVGTERGANDSNKPFASMFSREFTNTQLADSTFTDGKLTVTLQDDAATELTNVTTYQDAAWWYSGDEDDTTVTTTTCTKYLMPKKLKKVVITDDTDLIDRAFYHLINIESIDISSCSSMENILGSYVFACNDNLSGIYLPSALAVINQGAFSQTKIKEIVIPYGVSELKKGLFASSLSLETILIPGTVKILDTGVFSGCSSLQNVLVYSGTYTVEELGINSATVTMNLKESALYKNHLTTKTGFNVPSGLTKIKSESFRGCSGLTAITIPNSVTEIEQGAFKECNNMAFISTPFIGSQRGNSGTPQAMFGYIFGTGTTTTQYYTNDDSAMFGVPTSLKSIIITDETVAAQGCLMNLDKVETIELNSKCMTIADGCMENDIMLKTLSIPTVIGSTAAFVFGTTNKSGLYAVGSTGRYAPSALKNYSISNMANITQPIFYNMTSLTTVNISNATQYITTSIFHNNNNLKTLVIPFVGYQRGTFEHPHWWYWRDEVIRESLIWLFSATSSSSNIYANTFLAYYGSYIRYIPTALKSVEVTDDHYIKSYAFREFESLETIKISKKCDYIASGAMAGCVNLKTLDVPFIGKDINEYGRNEAGYSIGWYFAGSAYSGTYKNSTNYGTYYIPNTLTNVFIRESVKISNYAFQNVTSLESVTFDADVNYLGKYAFQNCTNLAYVTYDNAVFDTVNEGAFYGCTGVHALYEESLDDDKLVVTKFIPNTVRTIGAYAFAKTGVDIVDISKNKYTTIGDYAFQGCINIQTLTIPTTVTIDGQSVLVKIGNYAFMDCEALTKVTLGAGQVSKGLFKNCRDLFDISLDGITREIPDEMFSGCTSLSNTYFRVDASTTKIGAKAFFNCKSLTSFNLYASTTTIGEYAFSGCTGLKNMRMYTSVTTIGAHGWDNCSKDFYFLIDTPEEDWPTTWIDNWNCSYPVYIDNSDVSEDDFLYQYDETLRGYRIYGVASPNSISGVITIPEKHDGVKIVAIGKQRGDDGNILSTAENPFTDQPEITNFIVPKYVKQVDQDAFYIPKNGSSTNGLTVDIYLSFTLSEAASVTIYKKNGNDYEDVAFKGNENLIVYSGLIYYKDYWTNEANSYNNKAEGTLPYLYVDKLIFEYDTVNMYYDGSEKSVDVNTVRSRAVMVNKRTLQTTATATSEITNVIPTSVFSYSYHNNVNACDKNDTKNTNRAYIKSIVSSIGLSYLNRQREEAGKEKLYFTGTGITYFTILPKNIFIYYSGLTQVKTYDGQVWENSNWNNSNVIGFEDTDFVLSGTLSTYSANAGLYESDNPLNSTYGFKWSGLAITLHGTNVLSNFNIIIGSTDGEQILSVDIKRLDVVVSMTNGEWANDSTTFAGFNDIYMYQYTGSYIVPTSEAKSTVKNVNNGYNTYNITKTTIVGDKAFYPVYDKATKSVLSGVSMTSPYLVKVTLNGTDYANNFRLVKQVSSDPVTYEPVDEVLIGYVVTKGHIQITIRNQDYLIGYDDDHWEFNDWDNIGSYNTGINQTTGHNVVYSITGLGEKSHFQGTLYSGYYQTSGGVYQVYPQHENDQYSFTTDKESTSSTTKNIIWSPGTYNIYQQVGEDLVIADTKADVDYLIYGSDDNGNAIFENDCYDISVTCEVFINYNEFIYEFQMLAVHDDLSSNMVVDRVDVINPGTSNINDTPYYTTSSSGAYYDYNIYYYTIGEEHAFRIVVKNAYPNGDLVLPSRLNYMYNSQSYTADIPRNIQACGDYGVGVVLERNNFNYKTFNITIHNEKSSLVLDDLTKEYDAEPVDPFANLLKVPSTIYDSKATEFLHSIVFDFYYTTNLSNKLGTVKYTYNTATTSWFIESTGTIPTEIGSYTVKVTSDASDYFKATDTSYDFKITKRKITINVNDPKLTGVYTYSHDFNSQYYSNDLNGVAYDKLLTGHSFSGTLRTSNVIPGVYAATDSNAWYWAQQWRVVDSATSKNVSDYYEVELVGTYTINLLTIGASAEGVTKNYDSYPGYVTVTVPTTVPGYTIYYVEGSIDETNDGDGVEWNTNEIYKFQPGTYVISVKVVAEYYKTEYFTRTIIINEVNIEVTLPKGNAVDSGDNYIGGYTGVDSFFHVVNEYNDTEYTFELLPFIGDTSLMTPNDSNINPSTALVEYSLDGSNWTTTPYKYKDNNTSVRIYYRVSEEFYRTASGFVIFEITDRHLPAITDTMVTIANFDGYYDGSAHGVTVSVIDSTLRANVRTIEYSEDRINWVTSLDYTSSSKTARTVYVRVVADRYQVYEGPAIFGTVFVREKPLPVTLTVDKYDAAFDGEEHTVTLHGTDVLDANNIAYTVYYSTNLHADKTTLDGWSTTCPKFKDVTNTQSIYIWVHAENYVDQDVKFNSAGQISNTVRITTATATITFPTPQQEIEYGYAILDKLQYETVYDGVLTPYYYPAGIDSYTHDYYHETQRITEPTERGLYYVTFSGTGSTNCYNIAKETYGGYFEIVPRTLTVTFAREFDYYKDPDTGAVTVTIDYSGQVISPNPQVTTGTSDTFDLAWAMQPSGIAKDIGTYHYTVAITPANGNYRLDVNEFDMVIRKRRSYITIDETMHYEVNTPWRLSSANNVNWSDYGANILTNLNHTLTMTLQTSDFIRGTYRYQTGEPVGDNTIEINYEILDQYQGDVSSLYELIFDIRVVIEYDKLAFTVDDTVVEYDGMPHYAVFDVVQQVPNIVNPELSYSEDYDEETGTGTWGASNFPYVNAGTHKIYVLVRSDNYENYIFAANLVINKATLVLDFDNYDYIYDDVDHDVSYTVKNSEGVVIANMSEPASVKYYDSTKYQLLQLVKMYRARDLYSDIYQNTKETNRDAGEYFIFVLFYESQNWDYSFSYYTRGSNTIAVIHRRAIDVSLNLTGTYFQSKAYDARNVMISMRGATVSTAVATATDTTKLIPGHTIGTTSYTNSYVMTKSANAGTYRGSDAGFIFKGFQILDNSSIRRNVSDNYYPNITNSGGVTVEITKIDLSLDYITVSNNTREYAADYDELYEEWTVRLADPTITYSFPNQDYMFDADIQYQYYAATKGTNAIGSSLGFNTITDVGYYYVVVRFRNATNFEDYTGTAFHAFVEITPATVEVVWSDTETTFNNTDQAPVAKYYGVTGIEYPLSVFFDNDITVNTKKLAGTYTSVARIAGTDTMSKNYRLSSDTSVANFKILAKEYTINIGNKKSYNNVSPETVLYTEDEVYAAITGMLPGLTITDSSGAATAAVTTSGSAAMIYIEENLLWNMRIVNSDGEILYYNNPNPSGSIPAGYLRPSIKINIEGSITISQDGIVCSYYDKEIPYDGQYHTARECMDLINPTWSDSTLTVLYGTSASDINLNELKYKDVGEHTIYFTINATNPSTEQSYNTLLGHVTITITQVQSSLTVQGSLSQTYTGTEVSHTSLTISGGYNGNYSDLTYTYYECDDQYNITNSTPVAKIVNGMKTNTTDVIPTDAGYYALLIESLADSNPTITKNYTELREYVYFRIKPTDVTLNITETVKVYKDGISYDSLGSEYHTEAQIWEKSATNQGATGLLSTDKINYVVKTIPQVNQLKTIQNVWSFEEYFEGVDQSGSTMLSYQFGTSSSTTLTSNIFEIVWYVRSTSRTVVDSSSATVPLDTTKNYNLNLSIKIVITYPEITLNLFEQDGSTALDPDRVFDYDSTASSFVYARRNVYPTSVSEVYTYDSITYNDITNVKFHDPGSYPVNYRLTKDGYETLQGTYTLRIAYPLRDYDSTNKYKVQTKCYDGEEVDIVAYWVKQGEYSDQYARANESDLMVTQGLTCTFKKNGYNTIYNKIKDVGLYDYTLTIPRVNGCVYDELVITGTYEITQSKILISGNIVTGYQAGVKPEFSDFTAGTTNFTITHQDFSGSYVSGLPAGSTLSGIITTSNYEMSPVGDPYNSSDNSVLWKRGYTLVDSSSKNISINYDIQLNITITIEEGTLSYQISNKTVAYDGKYYLPEVKMLRPSTATITYSTDGVNYYSKNYTSDAIEGIGRKNVNENDPDDSTRIVYVKIEATNYKTAYTGSAYGNVSGIVTITKASATLSFDSLTKQYDGVDISLPTKSFMNTDHPASISQYNYQYYQFNTGTNAYDIYVGDMTDGVYSGIRPKYVGKYKIVVEIPEDASPYYHGCAYEQEFEITKRIIQIIWNTMEFTYDGTPKEPKDYTVNMGSLVETVGFVANITPLNSITPNSDASHTNAGYYNISLTVNANPNFAVDETTGTARYAILARKVTVVLDRHVQYTGGQISFGYDPTGATGFKVENLVSGHYLTSQSGSASTSTIKTNSTSVGVYKTSDFTVYSAIDNSITIYGLVNSVEANVTANYDISYNLYAVVDYSSLDFSVYGYGDQTEAPAYYDGDPHSITVTINNVASNYVVFYYYDESGNASSNYADYNTTKPTFTDAGMYTVYFIIISDPVTTVDGYYSPNPGSEIMDLSGGASTPSYVMSAVVYIRPKILSIALADTIPYEKVYDGTPAIKPVITFLAEDGTTHRSDEPGISYTPSYEYRLQQADLSFGSPINHSLTYKVGLYKITISLTGAANAQNFVGGQISFEYAITQRVVYVGNYVSDNPVHQDFNYDGQWKYFPITNASVTSHNILNKGLAQPTIETVTGKLRTSASTTGTYNSQNQFVEYEPIKIERTVGGSTEDVTEYYTFVYEFDAKINAGTIQYSATPISALYNGAPQPFKVNLTAPTFPDVTITYWTDLDPTPITVTSDTSVVSRTERGTTTVYFKIEAANYNTVEGQSTITVQGLTLDGVDIIVNSLNSVIYDGNAYMINEPAGAPSIEGRQNGTVITMPGAKNIIYFSKALGESYMTDAAQFITDSKAGNNPSLPATALSQAPTNAGEYCFIINYQGDSTFDPFWISPCSFTIEKKEIALTFGLITLEDPETISWYAAGDPITSVYTGNNQSLAAKFTNVFGTEVRLNVSVGAKGQTVVVNSGSYPIFASSDVALDNNNYRFSNAETETFVIGKKKIVAPVIDENQQFLYTGTYEKTDEDENVIEYRFGDEIIITADQYYFVFGDGGVVSKYKFTTVGTIDLDNDELIEELNDHTEWTITLPSDRNAEGVAGNNVIHNVTLKLSSQSNYEWDGLNHSNNLTTQFKINPYSLSLNGNDEVAGVDGYVLSANTDRTWYQITGEAIIFNTYALEAPELELKLCAPDGTVVRTMKYGTSATDKTADYYIKGYENNINASVAGNLAKIYLKGINNFDFEMTVEFEIRTAPPKMIELNQVTYVKFIYVDYTLTYNASGVATSINATIYDENFRPAQNGQIVQTGTSYAYYDEYGNPASATITSLGSKQYSLTIGGSTKTVTTDGHGYIMKYDNDNNIINTTTMKSKVNEVGVYLGHIYQDRTISDVVADIKNDKSLLKIKDGDGNEILEANWNRKFGTGCTIELYEHVGDATPVDTVTGIVYGDLDGANGINANDALALQKITKNTTTIDSFVTSNTLHKYFAAFTFRKDTNGYIHAVNANCALKMQKYTKGMTQANDFNYQSGYTVKTSA